MTKHSKKSAYPIKKPIAKDYFVGTDSANGLKTVNFEFEDVAGLINDLNGTPTINYQFKTDYTIEAAVLFEGIFLSSGNETTVNNITELYINKKNLSGVNLIALYDFIKNNATDFYLKLQHADNPNIFVYYNISSVEAFQDHFVFNVTIAKSNSYLTELASFGFYFFNFELKAGAGGSTDQDNKFRYIEADLFTGGFNSLGGLDDITLENAIDNYLSTTNLTVSDKEVVIFVFTVTDYTTLYVHTRKYGFPNMLGKGVYAPMSAAFAFGDLELLYVDTYLSPVTPINIENGINNVVFDLGDITGQDYLAHINTSAIPFDLSDNTKLYYFKFIESGVTYMYHFNEANSVNHYGIYGLGLLQFALAELVLFYNSSTPAVVIPTINSTAQLTNQGADNTSTYVEHDELTALEGDLVHKSGTETITGKKIFQNEGTDEAVYINNTSIGFGQYIVNIIGGIGSFINNNGTGIGQLIQNISNGTGMSIANTANGVGAYLNNAANGIGSYISNNGSGKALVINNEDAATGNPLSIQKNGVDKLTVNDAGEVTGTKFIKSGGTSDQYLKADGSVSTLAGVNQHQIKITTAVSITTLTQVSGLGQNGRNVILDNGANAINLTTDITSEAEFVTSYVKFGTSAITFVAGAGTTLVQVDGTAIFNGAAGSTAVLSRINNAFYLRVNNV